MKKFKKISSQGLTKDLIGKYIIFDDAKYFFDDWSQKYLIFQAFYDTTKKIASGSDATTNFSLKIKWY